jgi:ATP-dependent Clp protease ATP-binding subunit ClpX
MPIRGLEKPAEILAEMNKYAVKQTRAKAVLATAMYKHLRRIKLHRSGAAVQLKKSNVLLIGPSGAGKTFLAEILALIMQLPFSKADATKLTEAGYVGDDVEHILRGFIDGDHAVPNAEFGICFIDEIDKIAGQNGPSRSTTRDVGGEGVQQGLLTILQGTLARITKDGGRKTNSSDVITLDTSNILFIAAGAFYGLEDIIDHRTHKGHASMGFSATGTKRTAAQKTALLNQLTTADLVEYGYKREFAGRLLTRVSVDELTEDDLISILTEPKDNLVDQYKALLEGDVEIHFTDTALRAIAREAIKCGLGARGLNLIIDEVMTPIVFHQPLYYRVTEVDVEMREQANADILNWTNKFAQRSSRTKKSKTA